MSLSPVPSEQPDATCGNCGAQLVADQRYCLSCGQPVSPVRLAFLDVLAPAAPAPPAGAAPAAWAPPPGTIEVSPAHYVAVQSQGGANAWLRRNSGLLGLVAILGLFLLAGLLIGHWVSASKAPANTTIKVEGLGGLAAGTGTSAGATGTSETPAESVGASGGSSKQEAKEAAEGSHETAKEKAPPPKPKKATHDKVSKLTHSTGKKHQEEINSLGAEPIEVG